ncbi:MAG: cytochrome c biogenesis protein CcsA, partial [Chloroflexota bacterium]|nr:cytochrome c biogenesis protein CcsA [Chloroflexota bacterium]
RPSPLVPALQQSLLLTVHVATAMIAYGAFAVGFASAVLYMVQRNGGVPWLPSAAVLDDIGYRTVIIGFPFMTLMTVLGALWADIAWGRYWGWDPKETASLVTWFIYGGYLHARTLRGWRGTRSAAMLILGFAAVLFTYLGNYFLGGLHSYG